jgi:hypothetical protein
MGKSLNVGHMLAPSDIRKLKGQVLRDKVFELEKY